SPSLAESLTHVGNAQLGAGRYGKAIEAHEKAVKLREGKDGDPVDRADTRFGLAKALWESGDHDKARGIVDECAKAAAAGGAHGKALLPDTGAGQAAPRR